MRHIVGFSGGVDSQAAALWVRNRYPADDIVLLNSDAGGNEHPITTQFVADYSERVFPVTVIVPLVSDLWRTDGAAEARGLVGSDPLTFEMLIKIKRRAPSRTGQFCTEYLKLAPQRRWIVENLPDGDFVRYTGVRRDESNRRSSRPVEEWDDYYDCPLINPVADWTKQMCFDFVRAAGEQVNPLYSLGFNRVGCAPCINSNKADILAWSQRFPEMIDKIRGWERSTGYCFFPPMLPGRAKPNRVDEVVAWARTERGGVNPLAVLPQRPGCESKYGLCA